MSNKNELPKFPQEEVISLEALTRWNETLLELPSHPVFSSDFLDPLTEERERRQFAETESTLDNVPFPCLPQLNQKLILWLGDICSLEVDAIVCSVSENFQEVYGASSEIFNKCGPDLKRDLSVFTEGCKAGEAKMTKAFHLPSRFIFHTVGPRFNEKYRTASENALHGCYRSCLQLLVEHEFKTIAFPVINSEKRSYPMEGGAHIAIRTVRRFLEKWGDTISAVIFCVSDDEERSLYQDILPLYFPRSNEEALKSLDLLPSDIGNEIGETVVAERKIRISAFPLVEAQNNDVDDYSPFGDGEKLNVSILTTFHEPSDNDRRNRLAPKTKAERNAELTYRMYQEYLEKAKKSDLSEIARLNILYQSGVDSVGRPIMVFVGNRLPENDANQLENVFLYILKIMDSISNKDYVVIYIHTGMGNKKKPEFSWMKRIYTIVHSKFNENLRACYILHPTFWLKLVQGFFSAFTTTNFWAKVRYVDRLSDLFAQFEETDLRLPEDIYLVDTSVRAKTARSRASTADFGEHL